MMKRIGLFLLFALCFPIAYAGYSDGLISAGEQEGYVNWTTGLLLVDGGGADIIEIRDSACLEVRSTSTPLGLDVGGIMDLVLKNYSHLDYYGGATEEFTIRSSATANLYGGRIDYITSLQYTIQRSDIPHINIYCQSGWSWLSKDPLQGITGLWKDGSAFTIHFLNDADFDPVWTNVNVIPEPATMLLLGLGGLLIRRKK